MPAIPVENGRLRYCGCLPCDDDATMLRRQSNKAGRAESLEAKLILPFGVERGASDFGDPTSPPSTCRLNLSGKFHIGVGVPDA